MKELEDMQRVKEILEERYKYLLQIKNDKEGAIKIAPDGKLKVVKIGGGVQYYHRNKLNARKMINFVKKSL